MLINIIHSITHQHYPNLQYPFSPIARNTWRSILANVLLIVDDFISQKVIVYRHDSKLNNFSKTKKITNSNFSICDKSSVNLHMLLKRWKFERKSWRECSHTYTEWILYLRQLQHSFMHKNMMQSGVVGSSA